MTEIIDSYSHVRMVCAVILRMNSKEIRDLAGTHFSEECLPSVI